MTVNSEIIAANSHLDSYIDGKSEIFTTKGGVKWARRGSDILVECSGFNLLQTLDCGQAFRWNENDDGSFSGFFLNRELTVAPYKGCYLFIGVILEEFEEIWIPYFDFDTDYDTVKSEFLSDPMMAKVIDFCGGIRVLRQDPWETLISFIISQNNNIKRIKAIINRLYERFGRILTPEELASVSNYELTLLRAGFRAKYIHDAAKKVASGEVDLKEIERMPLDDARKALMKINGVGPKVADCVLLYGMHRHEAFPVDVWIRRALENYYPQGFKFMNSKNAGIAQQFLFHYIRCHQNERGIIREY
ncbi:MAG: DNA-3-methyladenine glycosylase 2 family protein [Ruminococcus sp.]|jgi:N-glycosylase/DNA lyase|nr:DNA-3-methyladenine glycosylase 2 family protein [Ruminococcus sp.]